MHDGGGKRNKAVVSGLQVRWRAGFRESYRRATVAKHRFASLATLFGRTHTAMSDTATA